MTPANFSYWGIKMAKKNRKKGFADTGPLVVGQMVTFNSDIGYQRGMVKCLRPYGKLDKVLIKGDSGASYIVKDTRAKPL